jgi:hypothetical protein
MAKTSWWPPKTNMQPTKTNWWVINKNYLLPGSTESAIKAGKSKFEETIADILTRQLKSVVTVDRQQAQKLCVEFSSELQMTQLDNRSDFT